MFSWISDKTTLLLLLLFSVVVFRSGVPYFHNMAPEAPKEEGNSLTHPRSKWMRDSLPDPATTFGAIAKVPHMHQELWMQENIEQLECQWDVYGPSCCWCCQTGLVCTKNKLLPPCKPRWFVIFRGLPRGPQDQPIGYKVNISQALTVYVYCVCPYSKLPMHVTCYALFTWLWFMSTWSMCYNNSDVLLVDEHPPLLWALWFSYLWMHVLHRRIAFGI